MDYFNNISLFNIKNFRSKFIISIAIILCFLFCGFIDVNAAEINVEGYYGVTGCTEVVYGQGQSELVDCSYRDSQIVQGSSTTYTFLDKAVTDFSGSVLNYNVINRIWLFGYYQFKKGNFYTLNYAFDNGSYMYNNVSSTTLSNVSYSYFTNDYVDNVGVTNLSYSVNYDSSTYSGNIIINFQATENTSSYRFLIDKDILLRNTSFDYGQGFRVYLLSAIEQESNTDALLGEITNQNNTIINQNQEQINQQEQTNDKLDEILDDEPLSEDVIDDFFEGIGANFTTDTPISDLILMPFTLLEAYSNGISGSCSTFELGSLFGTDLTMPCINLESILGSNLWNIIDMLFSLFMFYEIAMLIISIFDSVTSLDDSFQLLYTPRHGDMSRVGRGHSRGLY